MFKEETFGPVAAVLRVRDADEAVRVANDSAYGLGASLWTRDLARGEALARGIESGSVFVNGMVASDPRLPFGGVKRSGYGRELSSYGIKEFVNIQTIWIGEESKRARGARRIIARFVQSECGVAGRCSRKWSSTSARLASRPTIHRDARSGDELGARRHDQRVSRASRALTLMSARSRSTMRGKRSS